jgi:Reverse transcriptase (RNA-dependent DNA polymerase)
VLVFFDDILIYSTSLELHQSHLETVLQTHENNHLTAKWSKCNFGVPSMEYLGHYHRPRGSH